MKEIYLSTENAGKIAEIEEFFAKHATGVRFMGLQHLSPEQRKHYAPLENAPDFLGNAYIKAHALYQLVRKPVLAEDAGLVVDALGGRPGVRSARYAPTDKERIEKLLHELSGIQLDKRTARFVAALCYLDSAGNPIYFMGRCEGFISSKAEGEKGFGYDPIFTHRDTGRSFGLMTRDEKNRYSHRAKALGLFRDYLR